LAANPSCATLAPVRAQVRLARSDEVDRVMELENLAGIRYADVGLPPDLDGLASDVVARAQSEGLLWMIVTDDNPVGFALCWERPGALHLRELDVHPDWMGRGLGRTLVDHVSSEALRRGLQAVTLTTFREVPWNAPLYRRWGFVELATDDLPTWLRAIREEEDDSELRRWPRIAMARQLSSS
jgi:GNAT superfamily N-acetyltransferase